MDKRAKIALLWGGRHYKAGQMVPVGSEDPCRPDLFEDSADTKAEADVRADLISKVVELKLMAPSTAERCSVGKLQTKIAEHEASVTAEKKAKLIAKAEELGIEYAEGMTVEELEAAITAAPKE